MTVKRAKSKRPAGSKQKRKKPGSRSRHPAEERLLQCAAELDAVQQELESFCYSVSHDLRAPLRCIDGFSHALLNEFGAKLEPPAHEYLQRIIEATKRMGRLIEELLSVSRIQRVELQREDFNVALVAQEIVDELAKAEPERKVDFSSASNIPAHADRKLVATALQKLLENAWKFSSKTAAPRVEFSQIVRHSERIYRVRDNGVGFDMTYANRLFKAFQRLHSLKDFPGLGTGLAIARAIILRHGGRIWAESAPNEGATFFFTLGPG